MISEEDSAAAAKSGGVAIQAGAFSRPTLRASSPNPSLADARIPYGPVKLSIFGSSILGHLALQRKACAP